MFVLTAVRNTRVVTIRTLHHNSKFLERSVIEPNSNVGKNNILINISDI